MAEDFPLFWVAAAASDLSEQQRIAAQRVQDGCHAD
jgi:hypothetical protein